MNEKEDEDKKPSRKQKSLGLLCQKFLARYPDYPPSQPLIWISLDEVATSLGESLKDAVSQLLEVPDVNFKSINPLLLVR